MEIYKGLLLNIFCNKIFVSNSRFNEFIDSLKLFNSLKSEIWFQISDFSNLVQLSFQFVDLIIIEALLGIAYIASKFDFFISIYLLYPNPAINKSNIIGKRASPYFLKFIFS